VLIIYRDAYREGVAEGKIELRDLVAANQSDLVRGAKRHPDVAVLRVNRH
jgi:hypothetical protein